jgi:hypothetical protein
VEFDMKKEIKQLIKNNGWGDFSSIFCFKINISNSRIAPVFLGKIMKEETLEDLKRELDFCYLYPCSPLWKIIKIEKKIKELEEEK